MTVEEIISLDLGYAPPFSPVWDPVLVAARVAAAAVESSMTGGTPGSAASGGPARAGPARP